jgi:hypothetical protein
MNHEEQLEFLKRNYDNVYIRYVATRSQYRLHMGKFDPTGFLDIKSFMGADDYWTTEGISPEVAVASACREIRNALLFHCGIPRS